MALKGIDISSWNEGINLAAVPCDFVMVKATQGTNYTNTDCVRAVEQAISLGKLFGVYHYVQGDNAVAEANYFVDSCLNWIGKGVFAIDWEEIQNSAYGNMAYLDQLTAQVIARTGIPPLLYTFAKDYNKIKPIADKYNCGLWIAQYADDSYIGYQETPWNEGAYECAMRQYSGTGRLSGYGKNVDLDKFYGDSAAWLRYATGGKGGNAPAPAAPAPKSDEQLANEVLAGQYGNGDDRKRALGARYDAVQKLVNQKLNVATGYTMYTIQPGDNLSSIAARYGTTWQQLQQWNNIANPNLIYAGQRIRVK